MTSTELRSDCCDSRTYKKKKKDLLICKRCGGICEPKIEKNEQEL